MYTGASMSLDGFVSGPGESGFEHLFAWYGNGDVEVTTTDPAITMHLTEVSARHFRTLQEQTGAIVVGRKLFDNMGGWGGNHPLGCPVVVLSHSVPDGWPHADALFSFVSDGIEAAVAAALDLAGGRNVGLNSGTIASQALDAGLVDEIWVDLVPVILGGGTPFFQGLGSAPVLLDGPAVTEGTEVTHLRYTVRR